jgi:hypothetical protein
MSGKEWVNKYGKLQLGAWLDEFHRKYSNTKMGKAIKKRIGRSVYDLFKAELQYALRNGFLKLP